MSRDAHNQLCPPLECDHISYCYISYFTIISLCTFLFPLEGLEEIFILHHNLIVYFFLFPLEGLVS